MSDDPRAVRSRRRLQEALRALLVDEDLTEIGVAELCRAAGVHRTTFYGHYSSVGDVAADMYASWLDEAGAVSPPDALGLDDVADLYSEATMAVLESVRAERATLRTLLASEFSLAFRRRLSEMFDARTAYGIELFRRRGLDADFDDALAASFVSGGIVGAVYEWVLRDSEDSAAFTREIYRHMPAWWPRPRGADTRGSSRAR